MTDPRPLSDIAPEESCRFTVGEVDDKGHSFCRTCRRYVQLKAVDSPWKWPGKDIDFICPRDLP